MLNNDNMLNFMLKATLLILFVFALIFFPLHAGEVFSKAEFPKTDFSKHSVRLGEIYSGGPPRDGIKPIDDPKFLSIEQANEIIDKREPVVAVRIGNEAKAYPHRILLYHEIINDELNGVPILITHCPLCNTAIVFSRKIKDDILDFGTTGRVRDSNLIMYDRQTQSWWQQFTGDAIIGYYSGTYLGSITSQIVSFGQFAQSFPNGSVLSQDSGFKRDYGKTPYPGYDDLSGLPFLFKREIDFRLPPLERVLAIASHSSSVIYPFSYLNKHPLINTTFENKNILVISQASMVSTMNQKEIKNSNSMLTAAAFERNINGRELAFKLKDELIVDVQTNSKWNIFGEAIDGELIGAKLTQVDSNVHFAFAWLAFHPSAKIIAK